MDVFYAWTASVVSGLSPLVVKASSKTLVKSPWLFNILWIGFGIPPIAIYALVKGAGLPSDPASIIALSLSYFIFSILYID